jgi:hypothetical protein
LKKKAYNNKLIRGIFKTNNIHRTGEMVIVTNMKEEEPDAITTTFANNED